MNKAHNTSDSFSDLRQRAEQRLKDLPESASLSAEDVRKLVHELHVHQIELEMQNQELRYAETRAAANLRRYTDIYESAPFGYLSLNHEGIIIYGKPGCQGFIWI